MARSSKIKAVPSNLHPSFPEVVRDRVQDGGFPPTRCFPPPPSYSVSACTFGDPVGSFTMVLYGDSHAAQWFADLDNIARRAKWRLIVFTWESCPAYRLPVQPVGGGGAWTTCDQWHHFAISYINKIDPDLLIISQSSFYKKPYGTWYTPGQWQRGLEQLLSGIRTSKTVKVVIGDTPDTFGSECMVQHPNAVQHCSILRLDDPAPYRAGEKAAAIASGSRYIDVIPWFCTKVCSPIIVETTYISSAPTSLAIIRLNAPTCSRPIVGSPERRTVVGGCTKRCPRAPRSSVLRRQEDRRHRLPHIEGFIAASSFRGVTQDTGRTRPTPPGHEITVGGGQPR